MNLIRGWRVLCGTRTFPRRLKRRLPDPVRSVLDGLTDRGHRAWLVGGAVRDLLLGQAPADWDIATDAPAPAVLAAFPRAHPTGIRHGTVLVVTAAGGVEVTSLRRSGLTADLGGRDFTINALAWPWRQSPRSPRSSPPALVDPEGGKRDLALGVVRGCGDPARRFAEDPLRLVRAIRLACTLRFRIDNATRRAMGQLAPSLGRVAVERVRDEFSRILISERPARGLIDLRETGLLAVFLSELLETVGIEQNRYHAYPVWEHLLLTVANVPPELHLRLAALFHDVGKPRCLSVDGAGQRHFYGHEREGAEMAAAILTRLRYPRATVERVVRLVRHHMDLHLELAMSDAAILRLVRRVGRDLLPDLVRLRRGDRLATGTRTGELGPGTEFLLQRIDELTAAAAAFSVRDLAIDGYRVMAVLGIPPGPPVGQALAQILAAVQAGKVPNEAAALAAWLKDRKASVPPGGGRRPADGG